MRKFLFSSRRGVVRSGRRGRSAVSLQEALTALLAGRSPCWWGALRCSRSLRSQSLWPSTEISGTVTEVKAPHSWIAIA